MLFNTFHYLYFFLPILLSYYALPYRYRWIILLLGSYYFYMSWKPVYAILLILSTVSVYLSALAIEKIPQPNKRYRILLLCLLINLGLLFFFKYCDFFANSINTCLSFLRISYKIPLINLLLPIGISFYTFQAIGYLIDVYKNQQKAEKHFGYFALFLSYFPQLVAGPIERSSFLLPGLKKNIPLKYENVISGFKLILWGLFKKIVIADRLALFVDKVYDQPDVCNGLALFIATLFFVFQIYCDFSGYTDIAVGSSRVFGIPLNFNFNLPYFSSSITEFWRRWHITLSYWLRDYVYIPLGGNRLGLTRKIKNLLITMFLCGLWHGANWNFIIFGLFHGLVLAAELLTKTWRSKLKLLIQGPIPILITFFFWSVSMVFFRASSMQEAIYILKSIPFNPLNLLDLSYIHDSIQLSSTNNLIVSICLIVLLIVIQIFQKRLNRRNIIYHYPFLIRALTYTFLLWSIVWGGVYKEDSFIYFAF